MDEWRISSAAESVVTRPLAGATLGDFRLVELIGSGGMAEVWRAAWHVGASPITVALKRALPEIADQRELAGLFEREIGWAVKLHHPNIVRTLAAGEVQGQPYLAMELLDGVDLRAVMRAATHALPIAFAVAVAVAVADALAYLRTLADENGLPLGLVHRDVSPSNVMICRDGSMKLLDFGVAAALGALPYDLTGFVKGKWGYMAPEMVNTGRYDHRVDVYGLGVMLYELVVHRRLFPSAQRAGTETSIAIPPAPSSLNPAVPPELDAIVLRALAPDPDARFATADELARDLRTVQPEDAWSAEHTRTLLLRVAPPARRALPATLVHLGESVEDPTSVARRIVEEPTPLPLRELKPPTVLEHHVPTAVSSAALALVAPRATEAILSEVRSLWHRTVGGLVELPSRLRARVWRRSTRWLVVAVGALLLGFAAGFSTGRPPLPPPPPREPPRAATRPPANARPATEPMPVDPSTTLLADAPLARTRMPLAPPPAAALPPAEVPSPLRRPSRRPSSHAAHGNGHHVDLEAGLLVSPYAGKKHAP